MRKLIENGLKIRLFCGLLTLFMAAANCAERRAASSVDDQGVFQVPPPNIAANMATSLHATARGMQWWYERPNGLGTLVKVPYENTGCGQCHTKGCADCHSDSAGAGAVDQPGVCLDCHGRQGAEA